MLRDGLRIVFRRIPSGTLHHFFEKRFLNFLFFSFATAVTEFSPPGAAGCPRRPSSVLSLGELPDFSFEARKMVLRRNGGGYRMKFDEKLS